MIHPAAYQARDPQLSGWTGARQRQYPGLFSLWLGQESGRARGVCFVCGTSSTEPARVGCGGCHDLTNWWPELRPGSIPTTKETP